VEEFDRLFVFIEMGSLFGIVLLIRVITPVGEGDLVKISVCVKDSLAAERLEVIFTSLMLVFLDYSV